MKICRYKIGNAKGSTSQHVGVVEGDQILDVSKAIEILPAMRWPLEPGDQFITNLDALRTAITVLLATAPRVPLDSVELLSPIANPNKVICGVANYPEHVKATGKQPNDHGLFFKAMSSVVGPAHGVELRLPDRITVHETELAIVIGKTGTRIARKDALSYVAGYTIGLDMTMRGDEAYSFLKSPDTYTVLGPCFVTADEIPDPNALDIKLWVNGELRQNENTRRMVFDVQRLIEFTSSILTLYPGDVILTGNPFGATRVFDGDKMKASIEAIGTMDVAIRNYAG